METPQTEEMQEVLGQLEKLDQEITAAAANKKPALNRQRADLLLKLASLMPNKTERGQWIRQLIDMVSAAAQDAPFLAELTTLKNSRANLPKQVEAGDLSEEVLTDLKFRRLQTEYYSVTLADPNVDFAKAQTMDERP